jgi:hypothetical protein
MQICISFETMFDGRMKNVYIPHVFTWFNDMTISVAKLCSKIYNSYLVLSDFDRRYNPLTL